MATNTKETMTAITGVSEKPLRVPANFTEVVHLCSAQKFAKVVLQFRRYSDECATCSPTRIVCHDCGAQYEKAR